MNLNNNNNNNNNNNKEKKVLLTSKQIIQMMKNEKGIKFNICSEKDAEDYLLNNNNYMRTACYRKNYIKIYQGEKKGKYKNLEFEYLKELAKIDLDLRNLVTKMCLEIEHNLKVTLLKHIENNPNEDGYTIVSNFLNKNTMVTKTIYRHSNSAYTKNLISNYFTIGNINNNKKGIIQYDNCPIWVLLELISFGDFVKCYDMYYKQEKMKKFDLNILSSVISLRNACAHNTCILQNLYPNNAHPQEKISNIILNIPKIKKTHATKKRASKKISNRLILELTILLYVHSNVVPANTKKKRKIEIENFIRRCLKNSKYFYKNELVCSSFDFMLLIVQYFYLVIHKTNLEN